mgnify:FL=1
MAQINSTQITPTRVPLTDPQTGMISREWYRFFLNLFTLVGSGSNEISLEEIQYGPPAIPADVYTVDPNAPGNGPTDSPILSQITEMEKQIQGLQELPESLCAETSAEMEKQIQGLQSVTQPQLGTLSAVNQDFVQYLGFDTAPPWMGTKGGQFWYDSTTGQLNIQQGANVTQQIGEETFTYVRASDAITEGQIVARTGTDGTSGYVKAAPAPIGTTDPDLILGIATENIAKNSYGRITWFGVVHGLSTSPGFADGDDLFYDPTVVGGYTKTKPSAPNIKMQIGTIIKAAGGTNGSIQVKLGSSSALGGTDSNVQFGTLANGDLIQYNSAAQYWTNVTPSSVIAGAGGAPVTKTANFTVANGETWIINNKSGSSCTVTLPTASTNVGRTLYFQNYQAQTLVSASSNVVPIADGAAGTAILAAVAGDTCTLVSDGTNWIMMQYVPNNVLLLE